MLRHLIIVSIRLYQKRVSSAILLHFGIYFKYHRVEKSKEEKTNPGGMDRGYADYFQPWLQGALSLAQRVRDTGHHGKREAEKRR